MSTGHEVVVKRALWCLGPLLWALGCSDSGLVGIKAADDKITLEGEVCTGPAVDTVHEVRVLFLLDSSSSMRFNDPNDLEVDALEHITQRYKSSNEISFAIIRWGAPKVVKENVDYAPVGTDPPLFTNDQTALATIFARMRDQANPDKYLDGTDYELALRTATDYIVADIAKHPAQSLSVKYMIEFVTDGIPQSATNDPLQTRQAIVNSVANLHDRYGVRVDITSIALTMVLPPEFLGLLPEMARRGGGTYTQLSTPDGLDAAFDTALANRSFLVEYELAAYYVFNRNLRLAPVKGELAPRMDSDGDGLVDDQEAILGTDPTRPSTMSDGLSDLFKVTLSPEFDPLSVDRTDRGADGNDDTDRDGLTNFEERRLGTDPTSADTDRDGIPDLTELFFGLDALTDDAKSDNDGDHVSAGDEVHENTWPRAVETPGQRERYAYQVMPLAAPKSVANGIRCYDFRVGNIRLAPTLAGVDNEERPRPAGLNTLEIVALDRPIIETTNTNALKLLPYRQIRAVRWVVLGEAGQRDPQAVKLYVPAEAFAH